MPDPDTLADIRFAQQALAEAQHRLELAAGFVSEALGAVSDWIERPNPNSNAPLYARQSLAKAACEIRGEDYAGVRARVSEFRRFHNALRILMNIDARDFPGPAWPAMDWVQFRDNPWRYFITCEESVARALWAIIQQSQTLVTGASR